MSQSNSPSSLEEALDRSHDFRSIQNERDCHIHECAWPLSPNCHCMDTYLARVRNAALDEAARVARKHWHKHESVADVEAAILQLKTKGRGDG
jgi:hypothetical protein